MASATSRTIVTLVLTTTEADYLRDIVATLQHDALAKGILTVLRNPTTD